MKTLKKTLCLVLAVVMVLGIGVIPAAATLDYSDNDAITYAEAVDVMSGIGVLVGDEGGFRPTDTVRRSEAAKIIAYLLIGNAAQADQLSTTIAPFTDVPANHWAAGYIAYCTQAGIINGMGDGTFQPDSPVTGLQFAKMLLCALGYNANNEYVSDDWSIMVSKDALALKLFDKNIAGANNTPATREECALYAFNAIQKQKVTYSALLGGYIESQVFTNGATNEENTIAADFQLVKYDHNKYQDGDIFGREIGHHWYVEKSTNVITADYGADENLKATYTTGVSGADILNLLGKAFLDDVERVYVHVDGDDLPAITPSSKAGSDTEIHPDNFVKNKTKAMDGTGNGVLTIVYAGEDPSSPRDASYNYVRIVVINTYLAKVVDVKAGTSTKDPVTKVELLNGYDADDGDIEYTPKEDVENGSFNTEDFDEDDYVLITAAYDAGEYKIQSMSAVNVVNSTVSRYNKSGSTITVTAGGTQYVAAKNVAQDRNNEVYAANYEDEVNSKQLVNGEKHTLYVDDYGYLVALSDVDTSSDYVYVAQFGKKTDTSDDLLDDTVLVADIYYADGSHAIVPIETKKGPNGRTETKDENALEDMTYEDIDDLNDDYLGVYVLNTVKGKAVLSEPADTSKVGKAGGPYNVTKGVSRIDDSDYRADASTVFFYVNGDYNDDDNSFSVTVYTGINNIPVSDPKGNDDEGPEAQFVAAIAKTEKDSKGNDKFVIKAMEVSSDFAAGTSDDVYFYTGDSYGVEEHSDGTASVTYLVYVPGDKDVYELTLDYANTDDANDAREDADNYIGDFFVILNNDMHEFDRVTYKYDDKGNENTKPKPSKINESFYQIDVRVDDLDESTIVATNGIEYSYSANDYVFIDLRTGLDDPDDAYPSMNAVRRAYEKGELTDVYFAVVFDDNASNQISTIYLVDPTE